MSFNLSVVNIVPDYYRDDINTIAEIYGCGVNNLSVKLQNNVGEIFWGCHSWWRPEDYAVFTDEELRKEIVPEVLYPSLVFLYERLVFEGNAQENWLTALLELGLTVVVEDIN